MASLFSWLICHLSIEMWTRKMVSDFQNEILDSEFMQNFDFNQIIYIPSRSKGVFWYTAHLHKYHFQINSLTMNSSRHGQRRGRRQRNADLDAVINCFRFRACLKYPQRFQTLRCKMISPERRRSENDSPNSKWQRYWIDDEVSSLLRLL